jgi:hypothetical protein
VTARVRAIRNAGRGVLSNCYGFRSPYLSKRYVFFLMRSPLLRMAVLILLLIFTLGLCLYSAGLVNSPYPRITLSSISPNGAWRVDIVEPEPEWFDVDRNFVLRVIELRSHTTNHVFTSPDEGRPGTERISWSADSSRFIVLGRNFLVDETAQCPNGESLYLLYDVQTEELRCNATQQNKYRNFSLTDLRDSAWANHVSNRTSKPKISRRK